MLSPHFVIVGTLIGAVGSIAYLIATLKGEVKPNRVSFLLWGIAPLIAFAAMTEKGVGLASLMTLSVGVFPLLIFIASFFNKKADWKLSGFDWICGFLSFLGLILWRLTQEGNVAIIFSIAADGLAAVPTVLKAYKHPETEVAWPWIMTSIGVVITLLTLTRITLANSAFNIHIFVVNTTIFALVHTKVGKKKQLKTLASSSLED